MSLICPYTDSCASYANWVKQTKKERINIIFEGTNYDCLALSALKDPITEGGIMANEDLVKKINGLEKIESYLPEDIECSHIRLLNLLNGKGLKK